MHSSSSWIDLTSRQRSIWLDITANGEHRLFQVGACTRVTRALDIDVLRRAINDVIRRHDALRLTIDTVEPRQRVESNRRIDIQLADFSGEDDPDPAILKYIDGLFESPFDLGEKALVQVVVASGGTACHWLILRIHHIVIDAVSFSLAFKDLINTYNLMLAGVAPNGTETSYLPFQKQDALHSTSKRAKRDLDYWRERLQDLPAALFDRGAALGTGAERPLLRREINFSRYQQFRARCTELNVRPGNVLLALCAWLLASARNRDELVIGVAYPGRGKEDRDTIGIFSGVMPLRVQVPNNTTAPDLARHITQLLSRDYLHYRTPIDDIRRSLGVQRRRTVLVDAMVSFMPLDVLDFDIGKEPARIIPLRGREANPLSIYVSELNRDVPISLEFSFDPAYLRRDQAARLSEEFCTLFDAFIEQPQAELPKASWFQEAVASPPTITPSEIRIVSSFTPEPVADPLTFWLRRTGIDASVKFAGYSQVFQELLNPASPMRSNRRGANVILLRLEDWLRDRPPSSVPGADIQFLKRTTEDFIGAIRDAASKSHVHWLLFICPPSPEWDVAGSQAKVQLSLTEKIASDLRGVAGLDVITYLECRELYPIEDEYDPTSDQLGHVPYTSSAFAGIATFVARRLHLALRSPIKVIVTDCDNTLWDGIVGEDGTDGIKITATHRKLQQRLVDASSRGVLICLCSKNIERDVITVLDQRTDMILKSEHLVGHKINWKPKSENIRELAKELSLGLDSFLFLDDNPIEVAEVAAICPQVLGLVVNLSESGTRIDHLWPLDCTASTAEDAKRVQSYRSNLSRSRERANSTDFASFIESLDLKLQSEGPNETNLPRLAQLTERTNQFNINNVKRSAAELREAVDSGTGTVEAFRVSDKFGDYGIVGLYSAHAESTDLHVDTFLMSCRVLGRGVEHCMIANIGRLAQQHNASNVKISVRVTDRNLPVRQFLNLIEGKHVAKDQEELHIISAETAAAFRFRPEEHSENGSEENEASGPPIQVGRADPATWTETATTLSSVGEIEQAVWLSMAGKKSTIKVSRSTRTETEKILEEMFCHALAMEAVGPDDDFFDLGVHSLMAVQLVSRIRDRFNFQVSIRALFECSTIAKLAKAIDEQTSSGYQPLVPLQIGDDNPALFCCHPANGDAVCYMRLTKAIGADQTIYGFEASGLSPGELMSSSLQEMAGVYIKEMIAVQPAGPYHLLGWSFGGALAFEIAKQLHESGHEVGFVGFMDAVAPETGEISAEYQQDADANNADNSIHYKSGDDLHPEHEAKLLEVIAMQLNTMRRYARLPILSEESEPITWKQAIEGFQSMGVVPEDYSIDEMRRKMLVYANCAVLFKRYRPGTLPVPLVHFQASQNLPEWNFDWSPHTSVGVRTVWIRCSHFRMGFEPNTTLIAAHLRALIRGDHSSLRWWQKTSLANRMNEVLGRLSLKRA